MLDKREAFKVAFLRHCANAGLTLGETHQAVKSALAATEKPTEKQAEGPWPWLQKNIPGLGMASGLTSDLVTKGAPKLLGLGLMGAIGLPIAAGGMAGYGLAKAKGINDPDPDEIKAREKRDFYRRAATRALEKSRAKRQQKEVSVRRTHGMLV